MRRFHSDHYVLLLSQFFSTFGLMLLIPIMPMFMQKFSIHAADSALWAGIALSAPAIGSLFAAPLIGHYIDLYGHKKTLLVSMCGLCISMFCMAYATQIWLFIFARLVLGFCSLSVVLTAYISHLSGQSTRGVALGRLHAAIALACLLGPMFGGILFDRWSLENLLSINAIVLVVLIILAYLFLADQHPTVHATTQLTSPEQSQFDKSIFAWMSAGALVQAGGFGLVACFVLYIAELIKITHYSYSPATLTGILHALSWGAAFCATSFWGKRIDHKGESSSYFIFAALICGVCIFSLSWINNLWLVLILRIIQGFCYAALIPSVLHSITSKTQRNIHGKIIGVSNSAFVIGQLFGPIAITVAYTLYNISMALICTAIFFICAGLIVFLNKFLAKSVIEEAK
ncbi:MFS transporter [Acinetobacter stercoris]|uniref:Tetracycline resistance protein, class B n=1 Tax=Acinetobacter stercoris TaxID=2126983 RepID=A0A2U3MZ55_9GAMM|nr:MFS transporter [Acinetobacter stercoris]SPL70716.1 Tetracycline resistance protein, class B [Acinetobacter stercoris]